MDLFHSYDTSSSISGSGGANPPVAISFTFRILHQSNTGRQCNQCEAKSHDIQQGGT